MKITIIGDIHGLDIWNKIVEAEKDSDKIVFIGDYLDSFEDLSPAEQLFNFNGILDYKKQHIDKVVLLFGNHDYHYLPSITEQYSGYKPSLKENAGIMLQDAINRDFIQMCYIQDNYFFVHAGVTKTWVRKYIPITADETIDVEINNLFRNNVLAFRFQGHEMHGDDITQSPIWVRPYSFTIDKLDGYTFIVGHTHANGIILDNRNQIYYVDALPAEYLVIENGETYIKSTESREENERNIYNGS